MRFLFALLLLSSCEEPWTDDSDFEIRLGFVDFRADPSVFVEHESGMPILLEQGFQGGEHFSPAVVTGAIESAEPVDVQLDVILPSNEELLDRSRGALEFFEPGYELGGALMSFPRVIMPDRSLVGSEIELRVIVRKQDGDVGRKRIKGTVEFVSFAFDGER